MFLCPKKLFIEIKGLKCKISQSDIDLHVLLKQTCSIIYREMRASVLRKRCWFQAWERESWVLRTWKDRGVVGSVVNSDGHAGEDKHPFLEGLIEDTGTGIKHHGFWGCVERGRCLYFLMVMGARTINLTMNLNGEHVGLLTRRGLSHMCLDCLVPISCYSTTVTPEK